MAALVVVLLLQLSMGSPTNSTSSAMASSTPEATGTRAIVDAKKVEVQPGSEIGKLTDPNVAEGKDSTARKTIALSPPPDFQTVSTIRIPEMKSGKQAELRTAEIRPPRLWFLLLMAQHGAAAFDAYETRNATGHGRVEGDPFMRPFAHSRSIYVVSQIPPTVLDLLGRRMLRSQKTFIRGMWWLPQSVSAGVCTSAGVRRLNWVEQR